MRKLVFVIIGLLAVFTIIRAYASTKQAEPISRLEINTPSEAH